MGWQTYASIRVLRGLIVANINDLERGFEKTLAYAYGKHVVQGHLVMHNIDIVGTDKQVTLLMALGDGAYNNAGEGAWGITAEGGVEVSDGGIGGNWFTVAMSMTPVLFWSFNNPTPGSNGATIEDLSGNGLDGTLAMGGSSPVEPFGYPSIITSVPSTEIYINNDPFASYAQVGRSSDALIEFPGDFTLVSLLRPQDMGLHMVVKQKVFDGQCYLIGINAGGRIYGYCRDTGGNGWTVTSPGFGGAQTELVGVSTLVHLIRTGNVLKLYINGDLHASTTITSGLGTLDEAGPFQVHPGISGNYHYKVDEVILYDHALSAAQVANQFASITGNVSLLTDNFDRVDNSSSLGTTSDGQATWVAGNGTCGIDTNQAYCSALASGSGWAYVDTGFRDCTLEVTISAFTQPIAIFLASSTGNPVVDPAISIVITGLIGGSFRTSIRNSITGLNFDVIDSLAWASGDTLKVKIFGDTVEVYRNDVLLSSPTDFRLGDIVGTKFGFFTNNISARFDNLTITKATTIPIEPGPTVTSDAVEAVYYAGRLITTWHYHPGTFSTGANDPVQGIDPFFPDGITYSGTAYIAIQLPVGVADDADPSKVAIVLKTSCIADYDETGTMTGISYSANPARVKADMLKRRGLHTLINWDSFVQARDWYDGLLDWEAGDVVHTYSDVTGFPTFTFSGNIKNTGGTLSKNTAVSGYDNSAKTAERIVYGEDGYFELQIGGSFSATTAGGEFRFVDSTGVPVFGISWGFGHMGVYANGVGIEDALSPYDLPVFNGDTIRLDISGGEFFLKQNGTTKVIPQSTSLVPLDKDMFGYLVLYEAGASVDSIVFKGQEIVDTENGVTQIARFEAHPAFTSAVDLTTGMDFVDSLCASDTQDAGDEIIFLTPATPTPRNSIFTFIEDDNVIENTLRVYRKDIRERPNRLSGQFRNIGRVYMDQDEVFDSRDELFDQLGYIIDPGALNFASMYASQAQRLIKYNMRKMSDNDLYCDLSGMADSYKLLPGDIVTVISDKLPSGAPKDFIILTATRESGESTAYERTFTLQEWFADDYKDGDHGPEQGVITPPIPSPFDPPLAPVLLLEQSTDIAGSVVTNKILGKVYFATYLYAQTAKIYVTVPGSLEVDSGIIVTPVPGTNYGTFDYSAPVLGTYYFRAQSISYTGVAGGSFIANITILNTVIDDATGEVLLDDATGQVLLEG